MGGRHSAMINRDGRWYGSEGGEGLHRRKHARSRFTTSSGLCGALAKRVRTLIDSNAHDRGFQVYVRCADMTGLTAVQPGQAGRRCGPIGLSSVVLSAERFRHGGGAAQTGLRGDNREEAENVQALVQGRHPSTVKASSASSWRSTGRQQQVLRDVLSAASLRM